MSSNSNRLFGIEFAYSLSIIGCVMYIFMFTIGDKVRSILSHEEYSLILDFFPALFFFLNGMTVTLTMRDKRISTRKLLAYLGKRGSVLFLIGLAMCIIWPMNIFIASGLMYFLSQFLALWNNIVLRILIVVIIVLGFTLLYLGVPTTVEYSAPTLQGGNMINLSGFLFFNGYFSIIPWSIFFLAGMQFGRLNISTKGWLPPSSLVGIGLVVVSFFIQHYSSPLQERFDAVEHHDSLFLKLRFFYLAFIFYAVGMSVCLVNFFIFAFKSFDSKRILKFTQTISSMKYSVLFFQVMVGLLTMAVTNSPIFMNKIVLAIYILVASFLTFYLVIMWKKRINDQGPVEWVVKRIAGSTKNS